MKRLVTSLLFVTISLAPVFAAGQVGTHSTPPAVSKSDTSKTATKAKSHRKRHHKKHTTTSAKTPSTSK